MKLSYFDLLSPEPIHIPNIGGITAPTLKQISLIGYETYQYYIFILSIDVEKFLSAFKSNEKHETILGNKEPQKNIFELLISNEQNTSLLLNALNFFIKEEVVFSSMDNTFIVQKDNAIVGTITKDTFPQICDLICQRSCVNSYNKEDTSKVKSKKALEIMKKLKRGRAEKAKYTKTDKNMELGNIISAVASKSTSLNIINIWDLTVYQLWDCFARLNNNNIYDIQSMSVAAWGNKDNHFDAAGWFKKIETDN